jgi:hypothetical protein
VRAVKWLHAAFLVLGVALFAILLGSVGIETLWQDALRLGWGIVAIVAIEGVADVLRTAAWQRCFAPGHRPGVFALWWPNLAGAAVNYATPTATLGGEVVRGTLAPQGIPPAEITSSLAINRLTLSLADTSIAAAGATLILMKAPLGPAGKLGVLVGLGLLLAGTGAFFWLQRTGRMASLVGRRSIVTRLLGPERAAKVREISEDIDQRMEELHRDGAWAVGESVLLQFAARSIGAVQLWMFLVFMGAPSDLATVLITFLVARGIEAVAFFVPASLGVQEGGFMLGLKLAGLEPALGLTFSLALRVEQIVWAAIGFAAYAGVLANRRQPPGNETSP